MKRLTKEPRDPLAGFARVTAERYCKCACCLRALERLSEQLLGRAERLRQREQQKE